MYRMDRGLKIKFDGDQIDANTLINSLIHISTLAHEANRELGNEANISVKINSLQRGSFIIDIDFVAVGLKAIKAIFTKENVALGAAIVTVVGGLFKAHQFLKGKRAARIKKKNDTEAVVFDDKGKHITVSINTINMYQGNDIAKEALVKNFQTLKNDSTVEGFELLTTKDKSIVAIPKGEFSILSQPEERNINETEKVETRHVTLSACVINLEKDKNKWKFIWDGNTIFARIADSTFLQTINQGHIRFAKGDRMDVELEILKKYDEAVDAWVNKEYTITRVVEYIERERDSQAKLNFKDNSNG